MIQTQSSWLFLSLFLCFTNMTLYLAYNKKLLLASQKWLLVLPDIIQNKYSKIIFCCRLSKVFCQSFLRLTNLLTKINVLVRVSNALTNESFL